MNTRMKGLTAGIAIAALFGLTACGGGDPPAPDGGGSECSGAPLPAWSVALP